MCVWDGGGYTNGSVIFTFSFYGNYKDILVELCHKYSGVVVICDLMKALRVSETV